MYLVLASGVLFLLLKLGSGENYPEDLRIILLGKTGSGKSATGNAILGSKVFKESARVSSETRHSEKRTAYINGRRLTVIDTPGFFDTNVKKDELKEELGKSVKAALPGPHVFLYTHAVGTKWTEQDDEAFKQAGINFGKELNDFVIVVFTKSDQLKDTSEEEYLKDEIFNVIREKIKGRFVFMDNTNLLNRNQVNKLLEKCDEVYKENGSQLYTSQLFEKAKKEEEERLEREKRKKEEREEREREKIRKEEREKVRREENEKIRKEEREREKIRREENEKIRKEEREREKIRREERETIRKEEREREKIRREERETIRKEERDKLLKNALFLGLGVGVGICVGPYVVPYVVSSEYVVAAKALAAKVPFLLA